MSAWGGNGLARSCEELLRRVEENDPKLTELVILPMKKFGSPEVFRLAKSLQSTSTANLRSLQASGHSIEDFSSLEALGKALTHVESLAIGDSSMGDEGICALCRGIEIKEKEQGGSNELKSIDLSWKSIGKDGLRAVLRVLAILPALEFIDLSRNEGIGPSFDFWQAKTSLDLPTPIFPSLKHLDLSGCLLDAKSCTTLLKAMKRNDTDLYEANAEETNVKDTSNLMLKLNSNIFSDPDSFKEMMNVLVGGNLVTELFLSKCQIGDGGLTQMVEECCCSSNLNSKDKIYHGSEKIFLKRLDLSYNSLTDISCLAYQLHLPSGGNLRNGHHYLSNLRSLDLSGNPIGQSIETTIRYNPQWVLSLEELDLSHTSCEISGAVELVRHSNSQQSLLRRLNLFGNNIGSDGFLELSKVLNGGHLSLEYFDLGGNGASESGVVALVEVLKNKLERSDKNGIPQLECKNKLRVLVVGGNKGGAVLEAVVKGVQKVHPNLDIARDKPKLKASPMMNGNMFNNTPGTTWMS